MSLANSILLTFFTKEIRDGMHFRRLRDSFISRLSDFVNASLLAVHHGCQATFSSIPAAARAVLAAGPLSYFSALASSSFCQSLLAISHLPSAGRQLIRCLYGFVPIGFHIALASIDVFGLSLRFASSLVPFPDSAWEPTWFSVVLLLGRTDGGCSVCP
jgi:hypothetical protein